jgi:hypothetical protein
MLLCYIFLMKDVDEDEEWPESPPPKSGLENADEIIGHIEENKKKSRFLIMPDGSVDRFVANSEIIVGKKERQLKTLLNIQHSLDRQNNDARDWAVTGAYMDTVDAFNEFKNEVSRAMHIIQKAEAEYNKCETNYYARLISYRQTFNEQERTTDA